MSAALALNVLCALLRIALVATCVAPCCPTRATQHVTTFLCHNAWAIDSLSCRVVTWRVKWNFGFTIGRNNFSKPKPPRGHLTVIIVLTDKTQKAISTIEDYSASNILEKNDNYCCLWHTYNVSELDCNYSSSVARFMTVEVTVSLTFRRLFLRCRLCSVEDKHFVYLCGCAILDEDWVVTVAHCKSVIVDRRFCCCISQPSYRSATKHVTF